MNTPTEAVIPVSTVKQYLIGLLDEWNKLGDRKYDPPNMQVYNHVRKELDDLEAWVLQNCRAEDDETTPNCRIEFYNAKTGSAQTVEMYVGRLKGPIMFRDDRVDAYEKLAEIVGKEAASEYVIRSTRWL